MEILYVGEVRTSTPQFEYVHKLARMHSINVRIECHNYSYLEVTSVPYKGTIVGGPSKTSY